MRHETPNHHYNSSLGLSGGNTSPWGSPTEEEDFTVFLPFLRLSVASRASSSTIHRAVVYPTQNSQGVSCVQPGPSPYRQGQHLAWLSATLRKCEYWGNVTSQGDLCASDIASYQFLAKSVSPRILTHRNLSHATNCPNERLLTTEQRYSTDYTLFPLQIK